MFGKIIFIDDTNIPNLNHRDIKNKAIGASEYQFYNLIGEFSKLNLEVVCYNKTLINETIDNVHYKNICNIKNVIFLVSDKIIVQRLSKLIPLFELNKVFVWIHDQPCLDVVKLSEKQTTNEAIFRLHKKENIHFIFNSVNCKNIYFYFFSHHGLKFNEKKCSVIYNILYSDDFIEVRNKEYQIDKNKLVFGSAWIKGINKMIDLFRDIHKKNDKLQLVLLSPGYDYHAWNAYKLQIENEFKDSIQVLGPLDKKSYCEVIKKSLCVLSPSYFETFGCIFAESYYLHTPVIADVRSGAVQEIIDNNFVVDYSNPDLVLQKITELQKIRELIKIDLDDKFLLEENMFLWKKTVLFCDLESS